MKTSILLLFLIVLTGCSAGFKPLPIDDADRFDVHAITRIKSTGPMGVSTDGEIIVWSDRTLSLYDQNADQTKQLLPQPIDALVWSPDGLMFAVSFQLKGETRLIVFDRKGEQLFTAQLPARVSRLQWPDSGLLTAGVLVVKKYTFGSHIQGLLIQWEKGWQRNNILLYETTITPATTSQLADQLYRTFDFDLSPLGDEVLYTRLHAPPAFSASRYLVLLNLQTKLEQQVIKLPLLAGAGRLIADGETAIINDGQGQIFRRDLWTGEISQSMVAGRFDYEPDSGLLVVDGNLYQGLSPLLKLPDGSLSCLSFAGQYLLIAWERQLYLLTEYPVVNPVQFSREQKERLLKLRRLRSRGLIDQAEYLQTRGRLLP